MILYVCRHGQTDWNVESRIQGHTNTNLNESGKNQAKELANKLKDIEFDIIISSPLSRALDTAKYVNKSKNLEIIINNDLIERGFGDFEGLDDLSKYNCTIGTLLDYNLNYSNNNVESIQDLFSRIHRFIRFCMNNYPDKKILIFTHGGVVQVIESILKNLSLDINLQELSLKNCDYRKYIINDM